MVHENGELIRGKKALVCLRHGSINTATVSDNFVWTPGFPPTASVAVMQAYLADKYMSGPKAEAILSRVTSKKKSKRRPAGSSSTANVSMVRDEDGGWGDEGKDDAEDISEAVVAKDRDFKKRRIATADET